MEPPLKITSALLLLPTQLKRCYHLPLQCGASNTANRSNTDVTDIADNTDNTDNTVLQAKLAAGREDNHGSFLLTVEDGVACRYGSQFSDD